MCIRLRALESMSINLLYKLYVRYVVVIVKSRAFNNNAWITERLKITLLFL